LINRPNSTKVRGIAKLGEDTMTRRIPRLQLDAMPADLAHYLRDTKVERLGYLGEFFQCTANAPEVLATFMAFTDALGKALPKKLTELVALTVASIMSNPYERHQHERLSEKLNYGRDWIAAVERLQPDDAGGLAVGERAVQRYVIATVKQHGVGVAPCFDALLDHMSPAQAIAVALLTGRYVTHALVVNTLELAPPVESIFTGAAA
jgi:alkylhydroperoxidase family enzyme